MVLLQSSMVPLGTPAPHFDLMGIDDARHSLASYVSAKALVVIFMCNHCPYVQKVWPELVALHKSLQEGAAMLGINSNGANESYPEDSFEKMKEYAAARGQQFDYLYDEDQSVGKAYGAQCTPDIFVYGPERKLEYRGAFEGVEPAVQAIVDGKKPAEQQVYSMGCSIKWN